MGAGGPITWFAIKVAAFLGGGPILAAAIEVGLYLLLGNWHYNTRPRPQRPQVPFNTRLQYLNEPNAPHRIVYGEATLAPTIVADFSNDTHLFLLLAISPHDIEEIVHVRVNDQDFFDADEIADMNRGLLSVEGKVNITTIRITEAYDGISELRKRVNTAARKNRNAIMTLVIDKEARASGLLGRLSSSSTGDWQPGDPGWQQNSQNFIPAQFGTDGKGQTPEALEMKMSGMSWMVLTLPRSKRAVNADDTDPDVWNSVPNFSFRVRRSNSTLKLPQNVDPSAFSRGNAALCAYDYLARYTDYAKPLFGVDRIDAEQLLDAANFCEERGLTCNGVIQLDQAPADVMEQLGMAMNGGVFTESAGVRKIIPGEPSDPVRTITDDDIVLGSWGYSPLPDINQRVSEVVCRYVDIDGVEQSAGVSYEQSEITASHEVQLELVNNHAQAWRVARILLSRIWNGASLNLSLVDGEMDLKPYDKITIRGCGALQLDDVFRVLKTEKKEDGTLAIQCVFEADDLFDEHEVDATYIPEGRLPNYVGTAPTDTFRIKLNDSDLLIARPHGASEDSHIAYR